MYEKPFQLNIVGPDRVVFRGEATSLTAPGVIGSFQVLFNHAPLLAQLASGRLVVKNPAGIDAAYSISGGFVEVRDNHATVIADAIEAPGDIDVKRASAARERAEQRLREHTPGTDLDRARAALARAISRLRIAGMRN